MNVIKLFLASSIVEFEQARDKLAARIRGMNNALIKNGVFLELQLCEDFSRAWSQGDKQEDFNALIRDCHFFFAIVGKDVGDATREEIDAALQQFRESGSLQQPRIIVFFQDLPNEEKSAAVFRLHAQVKQAGQYAVYFSNIEKVYGEILSELFTSDAILNPEALESNRKSHFAKTLKIRSNRAKIKKLSKASVTDDTEAELLVLYRENMILTESERVEWGTLYEYAAFLHKRGYHAKAAEIGERLDAHYTADDKPDERAALKRLLADCHMSQGEHEAAEPYYRDALTLYRELAERKGKYRADAAEMRLKLAEIMGTTFRYEASERLYREALAFYLGDAEGYAREIGITCRAMQKLMGPKRGADAGLLHRAEQTALYCAGKNVWGRMGDVRENLRLWMETSPCPDTITPRMKDAEAQAREATKDNPGDYEKTLALICFHTAKWLFNHNQMETAEAFARKALEINRSLSGKSPDTIEPNVATSLNLLAVITQYTNRPRESQQCYQDAIEILQKLSNRNPHTFENGLAMSCNNLGTLLQKTGQYEESRRYYQEALEIQRKLAKQNPDVFESDLASTYHNIGGLLVTIKGYEEAEWYLRKALETLQRLAKQNPAPFEATLASACSQLASLLTYMKRSEEAERHYREALEIYRRLVKQDPAAFEPNLALTCYNYGVYLLDYRKDPNAAEAYFDEAIALYEKYPHCQKGLDNAIDGRSQCQRAIYESQYGRGS